MSNTSSYYEFSPFVAESINQERFINLSSLALGKIFESRA